MRPLAATLALALVLAGCTADDADPAPEPREVTAEVPFLIDLGGPPVGPAPPASAFGELDVEPNATAVLVEARWTCQSPTCALDVVLLDPEGVELGRASGTGEAAFAVGNLTAGTHRFGVVGSTDIVVNADGEARATAFYGQELPANFSAFDSE